MHVFIEKYTTHLLKEFWQIFRATWKVPKRNLFNLTITKLNSSNDRQTAVSNGNDGTLKVWSDFLKNLNRIDSPGFKRAVRQQFEKKQNQKYKEVSLDDCLAYLSQDNRHTVAIDLSRLTQPLICIDIDEAMVGEKIIMHANNELTENTQFSKVFGNPLLVRTQTPGHLHLYYNLPKEADLSPELTHFKRAWPCRLSFQVEYICDTVTVAGYYRQVMLNPGLANLGPLPKSLFPYNYKANRSFTSLLKGTTSKGDVKEKPGFIMEGSCHKTLFDFLRGDNFD